MISGPSLSRREGGQTPGGADAAPCCQELLPTRPTARGASGACLQDPVKDHLVATVRGLDTRSWRLVLTLFLALGHLVALRTSGVQGNQVVLRH